MHSSSVDFFFISKTNCRVQNIIYTTPEHITLIIYLATSRSINDSYVFQLFFVFYSSYLLNVVQVVTRSLLWGISVRSELITCESLSHEEASQLPIRKIK